MQKKVSFANSVYQKPHEYSRNMENVLRCPVLAGSTLLLTQDHARYPLFDFYPWQTSNFLLFLCEGCTVKFSYRYVVHEEPQLV